jgi:hypothetical protein
MRVPKLVQAFDFLIIEGLTKVEPFPSSKGHPNEQMSRRERERV